MNTRLTVRTVVRLVAVSATIFSIGCADTTTAPITRSAQSKTVARHDDGPPDAPCLSGWQEADGRWVCNDPI